jgi:hypothetical protein
MRKPTIISNLMTYSDADFQTIANCVNELMTGNIYFTATIPDIPAVSDEIIVFNTLLAVSYQGSKNDINAKNSSRNNLQIMFNQLGDSIKTTAKNNKAMLVSSGFPMGKEGSSIILQTPVNFHVQNGINPGEQISVCKAVVGAKAYIHKYTADPITADSVWEQKFTTICKCTIKNLQSAQKYWFMVVALGSNDQVVVSDVLCRVVQ